MTDDAHSPSPGSGSLGGVRDTVVVVSLEETLFIGEFSSWLQRSFLFIYKYRCSRWCTVLYTLTISLVCRDNITARGNLLGTGSNVMIRGRPSYTVQWRAYSRLHEKIISSLCRSLSPPPCEGFFLSF